MCKGFTPRRDIGGIAVGVCGLEMAKIGVEGSKTGSVVLISMFITCVVVCSGETRGVCGLSEGGFVG